MKKWNTTLRYAGFSLICVSLMMYLAALIAFLNDSDESFDPLIFSAMAATLCGFFAIIITQPQENMGIEDGFRIVTGCWIGACFFGAIPFMIFGGEFTVINAFFESVSGFTTTGASILNDIESLPKGLQFWRIASAWMGGIGIVTLVSLVISAQHDRHSILASAELSDLAKSYYGGRKRNFVYRMIAVYLIITTASAVALKLTKMTWFDAVTLAMSACSTCGFCTKNTSVAFYNNVAVETILIAAMLLGATNFSLMFSTIWPDKRTRKNLFNTQVVRWFLALVAIAILIVTADLYFSGYYSSFPRALRMAAFQVCSLSTTTGFATVDTNLWPRGSMGILLLCSLVCGCSGSTSGGMKMDRFVIVIKSLKDLIRSLIGVNTVSQIKIDGQVKTEKNVTSVITFMGTYMLIIAIGTLFFAISMDFTTSLTASIACMGSVGPGFGEVGSMGNYAHLLDFQKVVAMIIMLLGRVEIFPMLIAVKSLFSR
ncbi:MAG: TrkH family potassium uptake protein [Bacteroidales bacterium]|nr:TrkH family potassium uptake protein [Bacteroidales bacterium]MBR6930163.1 TrkH family potassium uptake protein [Bacteroidales bacterium]